MTKTKSETAGLFCLFAVYFLWGSTYLGIRLAVESIPPMIAAMGRHLFGGAVLAAGLFALGKWERPSAAESVRALGVGALTAGISNGALMWSEVNVPSAYASIAFTTMPLFLLLFNWALFEKVRPSAFDFIALPIGLLGSCLVIGTGKALSGESIQFFDMALLVVCPSVWAFGSLLGRRLKMPKNILASSSLQMLGGALLLVVLSGCHGDWARFSFENVTQRSFWGLTYLAIGGSLLGYTAFAVAIRNLDPFLVSSYAFVNPIIAVSLGYFFGERIGAPSILGGSALSITSVFLTFIGARHRSARK